MALIDNEEKKRLATLNQDGNQERITLSNLPTPHEAGAAFRDVNNKLFNTLTVVPRTLRDVVSNNIIPAVKDFSTGVVTGKPETSTLKDISNTRPDRVNESPTAIARVGGNMPLAERTTNTGITPNLSSSDMQLKQNMGEINRLLAAGESTKYTPAQIQSLREQAGFLRGGTDRRAVGRNGLPIQSGGSNYSIQGNSDAVNAFNSAVNPGEYSPEAKQARNLQREQFLLRQGFEKVDPNTGLTPSKLNSLPIEKQFEIKKAVEDMKLKRIQGEGIGSENNLRDLTGQATQMKIDEAVREKALQEEYNNPKIAPERRTQIERQLGLKDLTEFGTLDQFDALGNKTGQTLYNKRTGEQKQQSFIKPQPATTEKLLKMRAAKDPNFAAAEAEYKSRFGSLPY